MDRFIDSNQMPELVDPNQFTRDYDIILIMELLRNTIEYARKHTPSTKVVTTFTTSLLMIAATSCDNPVLGISYPSGALTVRSDQIVTLRNDNNVAICTARSTLPDFNNPTDVERFMMESSLQGGVIHPHHNRIEDGSGTTIGWYPC